MVILSIALFSLLSYYTAVKAILKGDYKPQIYTRIIWFLLAVNSLVGLIRLGNDKSTIALSAMQTFGSLVILIGALKFSILKFGRVEIISSSLLLVSLAVWLFGSYPAINVAISLIAYFVGGIPTVLAVIKKPSSESMMFWGYFAIASFISLLFATKNSFKDYMFPLYFFSYNLSMFVLSSRQYYGKHKTAH